MNNLDEALGQMSQVVTANTKKIGILAARAMVLGKFFDMVLPQLTASQCVEISQSFRGGIEDAMSLMDDVALPGEYHSALLELTNVILRLLKESGQDR
ncbi:hypothetical protein [Paraburkholderia sp. GAS334]|uniref:hypothetical protein n=1 Tax=Paraburkholderia sp. GAS334 TaxID=3035131 RepID=UPI003D1A8BBC